MTVSEQIIQVLDELGKKFGIAVDWTAANVLPYAQELVNKAVTYRFWSLLIPIIISTIFMAIFFATAAITIRGKNFEWDEYNIRLDNIIAVASLIFGCISFIAFFIFLFAGVGGIIECITFPEKVVFDMIKPMLS